MRLRDTRHALVAPVAAAPLLSSRLVLTSPLRATVTGTGDSVLVLGNGFGTHQQTWRHVVAALADECRLVRFDYVGTPDADLAHYQPERYDTLHGHVDDVVALLDDLDVRNATWVGHSVSGMIGLLAAAAAPERIARLVTVAASPRYLDDATSGYVGGFSPDAVQALLDGATADYHAWAGGFSPVVVGRAGAPEAVEEFASYVRRMRPDIAQQTLRAVFTGDYRAVLPHVLQPVTVVQPRADAAVPAGVGRYLAATLPSASYHELEAEGHVPHLTAPAELITVLQGVLSDMRRGEDAVLAAVSA